MRFLFVLIVALDMIGCLSAAPQMNPSGVWQLYGDGKQTYIGTFSWGKNPTHTQATVIDLNAREPFVQTNGGYMYVSHVEVRGDQVVITGTWAEGGEGNISIRFIDENTIWFEWATPGRKELLGIEHFFKRVPPDAPIATSEG